MKDVNETTVHLQSVFFLKAKGQLEPHQDSLSTDNAQTANELTSISECLNTTIKSLSLTFTNIFLAHL